MLFALETSLDLSIECQDGTQIEIASSLEREEGIALVVAKC